MVLLKFKSWNPAVAVLVVIGPPFSHCQDGSTALMLSANLKSPYGTKGEVSVHWSCHVPGGPSSYHAKQGPHERTAGLYLFDAQDTQIKCMSMLLEAGADANLCCNVSNDEDMAVDV